jgi:hypothetical protein
MPQVRQMLDQKYPGNPIIVKSPNEAVAMGAAILASNLALSEWARKTIGIGENIDPAGKGEPPVKFTQDQINKLEAKAAEQGISIGMIGKLSTPSAHVVKSAAAKSYGVQVVHKKEKILAFYDQKGRSRFFDSDHKESNDMFVFRTANIIWKDDPIWDGKKAYLEKLNDKFALLSDNMDALPLVVFENEERATDENKEHGIPLTIGKELTNPEDPVLLRLPPGLPAGTPVTVIFTLNTEGLLTIEGICAGVRKKVEIQVDGVMSEPEQAKLKGMMANVETSG